jgi:hypothetical protein
MAGGRPTDGNSNHYAATANSIILMSGFQHGLVCSVLGTELLRGPQVWIPDTHLIGHVELITWVCAALSRDASACQ